MLAALSISLFALSLLALTALLIDLLSPVALILQAGLFFPYTNFCAPFYIIWNIIKFSLNGANFSLFLFLLTYFHYNHLFGYSITVI